MSEACVILNDIHIDIMDYIKPAYCNEAQVSTYILGFCVHFLIRSTQSSVACGQSSNGKIASM